MFIIIYNVCQLFFSILLSPVAVALVTVIPKYRGRVWRRLTRAGLRDLDRLPPGDRIWVHALSVGEVKSVAMLVSRLRCEFPEHVFILSISTAGGEKLAREEMGGMVDAVIPFPLDFYPAVKLWLDRVNPVLFVQVETDFWPNFLYLLKKRAIKAILVNGRISRESLRLYRLFERGVRRFFRVYETICAANAVDADGFLSLGIEPERLRITGNLKYDAMAVAVEDGSLGSELFAGHEADKILIAASTHRGEEEIILDVYQCLRAESLPVFQLIAPRDPARGMEVADLAAGRGLSVALRSRKDDAGDLIILDTIGELAKIFPAAAIAFIGGSLVPRRGHNPLEAAAFGVPVIFGPSMEDFSDMASELIAVGGGREVVGGDDLFIVTREWLLADGLRRQAGEAARAMVADNIGVSGKIVALIKGIIAEGRTRE